MERLVARTLALVMPGFGWSFYGFFAFAALWCAAYLAWAIWRNRQGRRGDA